MRGQSGQNRGLVRGLLAALAAAFVLALLLGSGISKLATGTQPRELSLYDASYLGGELSGEGHLQVWANGTTIDFTGIGEQTRTLRVTTSAEEGYREPAIVTLYLVQYDPHSDYERATELDRAVLAPGGAENTAVLRFVNSGREDVSFRLGFSCDEGAYEVTSLTLNASGFRFNWPMFLALALAGGAMALVLHYKLYRVQYAPGNKRHEVAMLCVAALCGLAVIFVTVGVRHIGQGILWQYNPADLENLVGDERHSHYYHLFDALVNGEVKLNLPVDEAFAAVDNPYSPMGRLWTQTYWDYAYYEGAYYSYFGLAPMLLYLPVYWLTGQLPSPALAAGVPALVCVLAIWFALRELLVLFDIKPNLLLLALTVPAVAAGSFVYVLLSCADTYVQPYLWALAAFVCFIWWFLRALRCHRGVLRRLLLFGAGVCVVLIAASRPAMVLLCVPVALPAGLRTLRCKRRGVAAKLVDIAALALPVLLGAALLMWYNAARFGSPFEFGTVYQITVWDMRDKGLRFAPVWLGQMLYLYFFSPVELKAHFPYMGYPYTNFNAYGTHFYNFYFVGLMNVPLYWAALGTPRVLRKQSALKKGTYIGLLCAAIVVLWLNFCLGNALYRYVCDASLALALVAGLVLLEAAGGKAGCHRRFVYKAACGLLLASIVVGAALTLCNERNYLMHHNAPLYTIIQRIFTIS